MHPAPKGLKPGGFRYDCAPTLFPTPSWKAASKLVPGCGFAAHFTTSAVQRIVPQFIVGSANRTKSKASSTIRRNLSQQAGIYAALHHSSRMSHEEGKNTVQQVRYAVRK
jgi:hypothetical protein